MKLSVSFKSLFLPIIILCQILFISGNNDKYTDDKLIVLLTQISHQGSLCGVLESDYSCTGRYKRVKIRDVVFSSDQFTYNFTNHINFWLNSPCQKYTGDRVFWVYDRKFTLSEQPGTKIKRGILKRKFIKPLQGFYKHPLGKIFNNIKSLFLTPEYKSVLTFGEDSVIRKTALNEKLLLYRSSLMKKLRELLKKQRKRSTGLVMALWTGEKSLLSRLFSNVMKQAGASHILALSGLHTGILALYLSWLMKPIKSEAIRNFITALFLFAFLFVSGFSASLTRAVLFWLLVSIKKNKLLPFSSLTILQICALLQLLAKPEHLTEISFQLSYLSLTGILVFADVPLLFLPGRYASKISELFSASLGALLFTAPVVCLYWGSLNFNSIFSSLILIPLCSLFYGLSIPVLLLLGAGMSNAILFPLEVLYTLMYKSARLLTLFGAIELQLHQLWSGYAVFFIISGGYLYFKRIRIQSQLRLGIRDKNSAGYDGPGAKEKMGSEFPD